jgi:hypothetical protein
VGFDRRTGPGLAAGWVLALALACDEGNPPPDETADRAPESGPLRIKKFDQLQAELDRILELEPEQRCTELGVASCAGEVHRLVLGGPDAYGVQVYRADPEPGPTTPLAWDRVVLGSCRNRVEADLDGDGVGRLFRAVSLDDAGRVDPKEPAVTLAIETLYRRALLRPVTESELQRIREAYRAFETDGRPNPAVRWGSAVCAAVLGSREFVFY